MTGVLGLLLMVGLSFHTGEAVLEWALSCKRFLTRFTERSVCTSFLTCDNFCYIIDHCLVLEEWDLYSHLAFNLGPFCNWQVWSGRIYHDHSWEIMVPYISKTYKNGGWKTRFLRYTQYTDDARLSIARLWSWHFMVYIWEENEWILAGRNSWIFYFAFEERHLERQSYVIFGSMSH